MASFKVSYKGDAVRMGEMDVREFAPALLALNDLIDHANITLRPTSPSISLKIKAIDKGSFLVTLLALYHGLAENLSSKDGAALANLISIIFGGAGLFALIKKLKGKKPQKTVNVTEGGVELDLGDTKLTINADIWRLYNDPSSRKATFDALRLLETKGIDTCSFDEVNEEGNNDKEKEIFSADEDDLEYFVPDKIEKKDLRESTYVIDVSIITLSFEEKNKWKVSDGSNDFIVKILDKKFLNNIALNKNRFSKGDVLRVEMRAKQWRTPKVLKSKYEIIKVIQHLPPTTSQTELPLEDEWGSDLQTIVFRIG